MAADHDVRLLTEEISQVKSGHGGEPPEHIRTLCHPPPWSMLVRAMTSPPALPRPHFRPEISQVHRRRGAYNIEPWGVQGAASLRHQRASHGPTLQGMLPSRVSQLAKFSVNSSPTAAARVWSCLRTAETLPLEGFAAGRASGRRGCGHAPLWRLAGQ